MMLMWHAEYPRFTAIDEGVQQDGAKIVFLLRLSPLLPFNLLNYGLGITKVQFTDYAVASWLGMLPGTFAYVYLGSVGKAAVDAAGDATQGGNVDGVKIALYGTTRSLAQSRVLPNWLVHAEQSHGSHACI